MALNGIAPERTDFWDADVNASLRRLLDQAGQFDAIVLDPPKFAPTVAHAERGPAPTGTSIAWASSCWRRGACCSRIPARVASAPTCSLRSSPGSCDAGVDGYIVERTGAAPTTPMTLTFPEGE